MTVKDLKQSIENYIATNGVESEEDHVIIVDDWTPARYFDTDFATGSDVSRPSPTPPDYKTEHALLIVTDLQMNEIK